MDDEFPDDHGERGRTPAGPEDDRCNVLRGVDLRSLGLPLLLSEFRQYVLVGFRLRGSVVTAA